MGTIRKSHPIGKAERQASAGSRSQSGESPASPQVLRQYIARFSQASVLVIGDLILDHYIWGRVSRISPEAPVPVWFMSIQNPSGSAAPPTSSITFSLWEGKRTSAASSVRTKAAGCSSRSWVGHVLAVEES